MNAVIRAVKPAGAVHLVFYNVHPADIRASKLMGADVYNLNNEEIGEVSDLIINDGKKIQGVVVSVGGFLGIGDSHIAVDPQSITLQEYDGGTVRVVLNTTKEDLKNAPKVRMQYLDRNANATTTGTGGRRPRQPRSQEPARQSSVLADSPQEKVTTGGGFAPPVDKTLGRIVCGANGPGRSVGDLRNEVTQLSE